MCCLARIGILSSPGVRSVHAYATDWPGYWRALVLGKCACSLAWTAPAAHEFQGGQTAWSPPRSCGRGHHEKKGRMMEPCSLLTGKHTRYVNVYGTELKEKER